jgi:glutamate--cysteine ligase catalytic subunit
LTQGERGEAPLQPGERQIPKSRYDSISTFIAQDDLLRPEHNDLDLVVDEVPFHRRAILLWASES